MENTTIYSCRIIEFDTTEYRQTVALRDELLRKPLKLSFALPDLEQEKDDIHCVSVAQSLEDSTETIVGCLILTTVNEETVRMRQVAVKSELQGKGIGSKLVEFSEDVAFREGFQTMTLHARKESIPFYERLGYECYGEPFSEVGIPHRYMRKEI